VPNVRAEKPPGRASATEVALAVLRTGSRLLEELGPVFAAHGTTAARFDLLDALAKTGGRARPADLRAQLQLPAQTLTGVIDQLETSGLVARSPNPADRRSVIVQITPRGRAAVENICPPLIEIETDCMAPLSAAERDQLVRLLAKVEARIMTRRTAR